MADVQTLEEWRAQHERQHDLERTSKLSSLQNRTTFICAVVGAITVLIATGLAILASWLMSRGTP